MIICSYSLFPAYNPHATALWKLPLELPGVFQQGNGDHTSEITNGRTWDIVTEEQMSNKRKAHRRVLDYGCHKGDCGKVQRMLRPSAHLLHGAQRLLIHTLFLPLHAL